MDADGNPSVEFKNDIKHSVASAYASNSLPWGLRAGQTKNEKCLDEDDAAFSIVFAISTGPLRRSATVAMNPLVTRRITIMTMK